VVFLLICVLAGLCIALAATALLSWLSQLLSTLVTVLFLVRYFA
jgi:hypothetical protein